MSIVQTTESVAEQCHKTIQYPAEVRMKAAMAFLVTQSSKQASEHLASMDINIPASTIRYWKKLPWWKEAMDAARKQYNEQLDGAFTKILELSTEAQVDRLINGDERLDKDGNHVRVKVSARDAAVVGAVAYDKRALGRGDPTQRVEKQSTQQMLDDIAKSMRAIADQTVRDEKVIPGELDDQ